MGECQNRNTRTADSLPRTSQRRLAPPITLVLVLAALATAFASGSPLTVRAVEQDDLRRALLATVRLAVPVEGERDTYSTGSGTILTEEGLILTNFHVLGDTKRKTLYNGDGLAFVAINPSNLKGLPTWLYTAEILRGDPLLDLALLKINGYMESNSPLPQSLGLVTMSFADSDDLAIGDELSVIGFPGIGGDTVTFTQGRVSGFLDEDRDSILEWIKTDAEVNHGNSGGLAIDASGEMIGVPTAGVSDVEAAGKISLIRPINLALPLVGTGGVPRAATCRKVEEHRDGATISSLVFGEAVDRNGSPEGVAHRFDSGLNAVYGVFDYDRFRNGREFRFTWYLDGQQVFEDAVDWEGGSRGSDWVNIYRDSPLPDGVYNLELRYDDVLLACGNFALGVEVADTTPSLGPITFAAGQSNDQPVGPATQFGIGAKEIYAFFDYSGMVDGMEWRQVWYVDGEVGLDTSDAWNAGEAGNFWVSISSERGLPEGDYALELYVEGELLQSGEFLVTGGTTPQSQPTTSEGVAVVGTVVDANRRSQPVVEAVVIFLTPGTSIQQWARTEEDQDVYAAGVTDTSGQFQLSRNVMPGETYPVVVVADGYRPVTEPNFTIPASAKSPYQLDITMVRE